MRKRTLNYKFNNPNSEEDTAEFLLKFFVEVNRSKVERAIKSITDNGEKPESHPA